MRDHDDAQDERNVVQRHDDAVGDSPASFDQHDADQDELAETSHAGEDIARQARRTVGDPHAAADKSQHRGEQGVSQLQRHFHQVRRNTVGEKDQRRRPNHKFLLPRLAGNQIV